MTSKQFAAALAIAQSNADLSNADDSALFGFGLADFQPVDVTLAAVARCIRWQSAYIYKQPPGMPQYDLDAIAECKYFFVKRARVNIIDNALRDCINAELSAIASDASAAAKSGDMESVQTQAFKLDAFKQYVASSADKALSDVRAAVSQRVD